MTTEEKLQAILNAMPLSTDGINNAMNEPYQFVDKLGITAVIDEIMDRIPGSGASNPLPAPSVDFVIYGSGDKGLMKLTLGYSELGNVKVVMANGRAPELTDPEVTPEGTLVEANGVYQIVAIQQDITYPQGSSYTTLKEINNLKCQKPKIAYDEDTYTVSFTSVTAGSTIRYTTDGTEPTESSTAYSSPFTISEAKTITAKAFKTGLLASDSVVGKYDVATVCAVRFSRNGYTGTRLTPETDPLGVVTETITQEPQPEIPGIQSGFSQFDNYSPWQKKRRNFIDDGTGQYIPGKWDSDYGFSTVSGDVMVYYPDAYIKWAIDLESDTETFYISSRALSGFEKAPWSSGYKSAYLINDNYNSISGQEKLDSTTGDILIENVRKKGVNWHVMDGAMCASDIWLFMVEFATRDYYSVFGSAVYAGYTGETDIITYHTGKTVAFDTAGRIRYRWTEDLGSFTGKLCIGIRCKLESDGSVSIYATDNPELYYSEGIEGWTKIKQSEGPYSGYYISEFEYIEEFPWMCFIPSAVSDGSQFAAKSYFNISPNSNYSHVPVTMDIFSETYLFSMTSSSNLENNYYVSYLIYRETKVHTPEIYADTDVATPVINVA